MGRAALRVGTSGYQYRHWRGRFYPRGLPQRAWFEHYASVFDSVEINNTFYRLPEPETFDHWREAAPPGFRYALKFSRYGSHLKRLLSPEATIPAFLERAERLRSFLGPVLVQLPPHWNADVPRLDDFLAAAPRRVRWAVELRDPSWLCDATFEVLDAHGVALCVHDLLPDHPRPLTADWTYLRFHGTGPGYRGGYSPQKLSAEARRIDGLLARGVDVWAYFNNDVGGHAPRDALALRRYVRGASSQPSGLAASRSRVS
jgi:uncharacterized protein YecE (DUF72 family)